MLNTVHQRGRPDDAVMTASRCVANPIVRARASRSHRPSDLPTLLTAVRRAACGEVVMRAVPSDAFEAAVARLEDEDLPVFAMLLDREPYDPIAEALRIDPAEVSRRAQRIVGRLRPRRSVDLDNHPHGSRGMRDQLSAPRLTSAGAQRYHRPQREPCSPRRGPE